MTHNKKRRCIVHRRPVSLFDISHLLQIRLVATELHIDHGIGVYKINEFCFTDPFVGYGFPLLEFDGTLLTVGDTEKVFIDGIVRYESSDFRKRTGLTPGRLPDQLLYCSCPGEQDLRHH